MECGGRSIILVVGYRLSAKLNTFLFLNLINIQITNLKELSSFSKFCIALSMMVWRIFALI
jgi:hypothetical protein